MRYFGLLGKKLGHSFSQKWFREKFSREGIDADYLFYETDDVAETVRILMRKEGMEGFNVTVPYKKDILAYCDYQSKEVVATGSANCIRLKRGFVEAFNTDVDGFRHLLSLIDSQDLFRGVLILGTGGGAAAVNYVSDVLDIPAISVSRNPLGNTAISYSDITGTIIEQHPVIINTTPVGMWPDNLKSPPFPYHYLTGNEVLVDLIYNPEITTFMAQGIQKGCKVLNGLPMLERQAERSWELWR